MLTELKEILETSKATGLDEEVLSFPEYLELVKREPWTTRNTFQLLHDMLLSERSGAHDRPRQADQASLRLLRRRHPRRALRRLRTAEGEGESRREDRQREPRSRGLEAALDPARTSRRREVPLDGRHQDRSQPCTRGRTRARPSRLLLPTVDERLKEKAALRGRWRLLSAVAHLRAPPPGHSPGDCGTFRREAERARRARPSDGFSRAATRTTTATSESRSTGSSRPSRTSCCTTSCGRSDSTSPACCRTSRSSA